MPSISRLAKRVANVPLAMRREDAKLLAANAYTSHSQPMAMMDDDYGTLEDSARLNVIDGVAVISIKGVLIKEDWGWYGCTGYDWIRKWVGIALQDPDTRAIALDIDSPGGEVTGCFDLVDALYEARGIKPMWAILSESAYSAAYAIASACDRIIVPRTGGTGSVGVICMVTELSKMLEQMGVAVTIFQFGERKADGNPFEPIAPEAIKRFQAEVNTMGEMFVATVARNRDLSAEAVRNTEATTFLGAAGVKVGFADAVMAPNDAFQSLLDQLD